ncbi:MAG: hypothetical protein NUV78_01715 [Candidatus Zambryskibacteria bacterium]|nr:hypothetical protein [Candidatus Zambryskibacteria bacterium]
MNPLLFTPPSTGTGAPRNFSELVEVFLKLIELLIPVIASLALLAFFWGLVKFIGKVGGDEKAVSEGKSLMVWGLIALFIMITIWGIIAFFSNEAGFTQFGIPQLPTN